MAGNISDENRQKRDELRYKYNRTKSHKAYAALMDFEEFLLREGQNG